MTSIPVVKKGKDGSIQEMKGYDPREATRTNYIAVCLEVKEEPVYL